LVEIGVVPDLVLLLGAGPLPPQIAETCCWPERGSGLIDQGDALPDPSVLK
jgi:hypothetical protein